MSDELKEKIIRLATIPTKLETAISKSKGIKIKERNIDRFTFDELEKAMQELELPKRGQKIISEFLEYLKSKAETIMKSKPSYINIKFKVKDLDKINKYISSRKDIRSFRSFVISKLYSEFGITPPKNFSIFSKKEIKSPQILVPEDIIYKLRQKIMKRNRKIGDKDLRALIRKKIESIIEKIEKEQL